MANTKDICVLLRAVCNLCEGGHAGCAREFEDMGGVLDDVDVDVSSFERIYTGT